MKEIVGHRLSTEDSFAFGRGLTSVDRGLKINYQFK